MENELSRVVGALPGLVWTALPDGQIDFLNQRRCEYTGLSVDEVPGQEWQAAIHPEDLGALLEGWHSIVASGEPREIEARIRRFDGEYRWFLFTTRPLADASGQIFKWCGMNTDIEDRKRAEALLAGEKRFLEMVALTASIAHEVNQPLSGIITNASTCLRMLAADPPNVEGARETARRTIRDGNRASDVIKRLRALFGKKDAASESVDLNEATREVIALSSSDLQRSRVTVRPELADDLPPVTGDRVQLQQVILNLFLNVSDAMSGIDDRPRQLVIRTERDEGDHVRLSVQDAGVGFEPQGVDRLFDAFYTTKSDGMGIGLSVSRSIIESHHGRLWAAANEGPGATFSFSIPQGVQHVTDAHSLGAVRTSAVTEAAHAMRNS